MPSENEDETLREAERLIAGYRSAASNGEKYRKLEKFVKLLASTTGNDDSCSEMFRVMKHVELLPLIMGALTAKEPITMDVIALQILMLVQLQNFLYCCSVETPNPWPMRFRQFANSLPKVFDRSFEIIEEKKKEHSVQPLRLTVLKVFLQTFWFFDKLDEDTPFVNRMDVPKFLDILWTCAFSPPGPSAHGITSNVYLLDTLSHIFAALSKTIPTWTTSYLPASLTRAVNEYGSARIAQSVKESCETTPTNSCRPDIDSVVSLIVYVTSNTSIKIEILKAGVPRALLQTFWTWIRTADDSKGEEDIALATEIYRIISTFFDFLSETTAYRDLMKRTVQELLEEDFMMVVGRYLCTAQYQERFMEEGFMVLLKLFQTVFRQVYGIRCQNQELWHTFSHVLNCTRAYCRVHGDSPALAIEEGIGYRAVTYIWQNLGETIGVREDHWWERYVWGALPVQVRKMGCKRMKCPNFGMDYLHILTAGPTPLVCTRCRAAFYCSLNCQKDDWSNHQRNCSRQNLSAATGI